jgi:hypothetical protein
MRARLTRVGVLIISATALLAAATGTGAAAADRGSPAKAGHWTQVTAAGQENFADIGLVRGTNGVLHVVWTGGTTGKTDIYDTPIEPDGTVGRAVVITAHLNQATYPDATAWSGTLHAFWNQISNASQIFDGTAIATWPAGGRHWNPITGVSPAITDGWGDSVAATTGADGKPWVAFIDSDGFEVLHIGHAKLRIPFTQLIHSSGCCINNPGIGADGRTAAAWLTWSSSITGHVGIYAQQLKQNGSRVGAAVRLPGSDTTGNINQRPTAIGMGRGRPGVYVSYVIGYPFAHRVDVIRLGTRTPVVVAKVSGASGSTLAADPEGRLWVAWYTGLELFVRRAAAGASRFGPVQRVPLPKDAILWKVYINAQAKRLDVVALLSVGRTTAYWATQVRPAS